MSLVQELSRLLSEPCECEPATWDSPFYCCPRCERIGNIEDVLNAESYCQCGVCGAGLVQICDGEEFCPCCNVDEVAA